MTLVLDPPDNLGLHSSPVCPHGPTLLFYDKPSSYYYYACSASRDHQFCPFKLSAQKWKRLASSKNLIKNPERTKPDHQYLLDHPSKCGYCLDCCRVLLTDDDPKVLAKHYASKHSRCKNHIDGQQFEELVARPCLDLLTPQTHNENLAQYYFSKQTLNFIRDHLVQAFHFDKILCIGCPTVHEELLLNDKDSFLLDLDARYYQFYKANRFARFNMFNGHFFDHGDDDEYGKKSFKEFVQTASHSILVLIDPPFGGLIECLARTVHEICNKWMTNSEITVSIALFFPYFNEHWIRKAFENDQVRITDFIVTYENHSKFKRKSISISASPVRLFTNLNLNDFTAIDPAQYRWCEQCKRTIFRNNNHCNQCGQCPARDSTKPIQHCSKCERCVKITSSHCDRCNTCHLPNKHQSI